MDRLEEPQATSSTDGSSCRMARAVSAARRPYSAAVLWPVCQGPSISLPRHHSRMPKGSASPWAARRSARAVPQGWLAYSWSSRASATPRVPRLTAIIGSVCGAGLLQEGDELGEAEPVGLRRAPGEVQAPGAVLDRADRVLPPVAGDEVAAGIADGGDAEFADQVQDVGADALGVGRGMAGLEDAGVDAAAQVLDEGAEEAGADVADGEGGVQGEAGGAQGSPFGESARHDGPSGASDHARDLGRDRRMKALSRQWARTEFPAPRVVPE